MATQPLYQSYNPPVLPVARALSTRADLHNGIAAAAVTRAMANVSVAVSQASLDEIAIVEKTLAVIRQGRRSLPPTSMPEFLKWAAAASALSTRGESDEENDRNLGVLVDTLEVLGKLRSVGTPDLVFRTYVLALEATQSSCFGPMRQPEDDDTLVERLAYDSYLDIRNLDPLPDMLDELARTAWEASDSKLSFSPSIGKLITNTFTTALAGSSLALTLDAEQSILTRDWKDAVAVYEAARSLWDGTDVDADEASERLDDYLDKADHLIVEMAAPDAAAISMKFALAAERHEGFQMSEDCWKAIEGDVLRLLKARTDAEDLHPAWLAERNGALLEINSRTEAELSDADCDAISDYAIGKELLIIQEPARSERGVIAKLALLVQNNLEGHVPDLDECAAAILEANRLCGIGSLAAAANACHREMAA